MQPPESIPPKPDCGAFQTVVWDETRGSWRIRDLTPEEMEAKFPPPEPEPEPDPTPEDLLAQARAARAAAYRLEADPLFFKWQRAEGSEQDWLDKVAEIRAAHPYPEGDAP
ncbi:hypothetical protein [Roseinatronobacter sp.]